MTALSIRHRIEWLLVSLPFGGGLIWLAYFMVNTEGDTAGLAAYFCGIMGIFLIRQMLLAPPTVSVTTWWYLNCRKFNFICVDGEYYYYSTNYLKPATWTLYDREGYLVGHMIEFGDGGSTFFSSISKPVDGQRTHNVKWFSRLRSPKLPKPRAEVISDGEVIGYTTYSER